MAYSQRIETAIFDMDGLLIDSEPLWLQAELDIFGALGLDLSDRHKLPDTWAAHRSGGENVVPGDAVARRIAR